MDLLKPPRLKEGDVVATISLSSGYAGSMPVRYGAGKQQLEQTFELKVIEAPNSQRDATFLYENPQARVDDLHWAITNEDVAGIVSNIGGSESVRLLPLLGRPYRYAEAAKLQLFDAIRKVMREFGRVDMPVVADLDFGHTSPRCVLPNGCNVLLDGSSGRIELAEGAGA